MNSPAKPIIHEIAIKGFRSLANVSISLSNPTFFVGRNGAGKSNITDALSFLSDAVNSRLQWAIDRRGGMKALCTKTADGNLGSIAFLIRFGTLPPETMVRMPASADNSSRYSFEIKPLQNGGYEVLREQAIFEAPNRRDWFDLSGDTLRTNAENYQHPPGHQTPWKWMQTGSLVLPTFGGTFIGNMAHILRSACVYGIEPAAVRSMQEPDAFEFLKADGSNAATILEAIGTRRQDVVKQIVNLLSAVLPGIEEIKTVNFANRKALEFTLAWEGSRIIFDAHSMSSGSLRALGLLLAIFQPNTPTILGIEEPENSMHPGATSVLLDLLNFACSQSQVLITTQSPEVLDAGWIRDENLRIVSWQSGQTIISDVPQASRTALQDHLMTAGELFRSEAFVPEVSPRKSETDTAFFLELV